MAKMFDKVSESVLGAIKSVTEKKLTPAEMKKREEVAKAIERDNPDMPMPKKMAIATATAKKVAEAKLDPVDHKALKGSHADRKDKDIDNDGKVDKTDEYLHNRRKAVKHAMAKKMKEEAEKAASRYLGKSSPEKKPEEDRAKRLKKKVYGNMMGGLKKEEAEQIDELSKETKASYMKKAAAEIDKHYDKSKTDARSAYKYYGRKNTMKKIANEEVELLEGKMKALVTKHMEAGHDYNAALNKAKKDLEKMKKEDVDLTPEEIAMIEAKMAGVADDALPGNEHMCATKVFHKEWKEGTPVPTMHADPDDQGLIEWYDVMFDHGIERVMTEDMEILDEMMHSHKKKMKEETCGEGEYWCMKDQKCKPIPDGMKVDSKGMLVKEEAEQIDELSLDTLGNYMNKASDARGHRGLSTKKVDNRYKGVALAQKKGDKQAAKMQGKLKPVKTDYERQMDDSHRHIYGEEADVPFKGPYKKTGERKDEYGNTVKNVAKHLAKKAMKKQMGEENEITEARGRPKKAGQMDYTVHPKTKEKMMHNNPTHMKRIENLYRTGALKRPKTEAGQNIVTQLRKASTSMRGGETVNFTHGTAKHVSAAHAQKLLDKHAGMRPAEKEAFQKKIGHSHEEMKKHV
jgi:hypothetical protein